MGRNPLARKVIVGTGKKRYTVVIPGRWRNVVGLVRMEENTHPQTTCPECVRPLGKIVAYVLTPVRLCGGCKAEVEG